MRAALGLPTPPQAEFATPQTVHLAERLIEEFDHGAVVGLFLFAG